MNIVLREPWTVERFLEWEDRQEGRHEFDGTQIIPMTGGSRAHQRIVGQLVALLLNTLDLSRFDVLQEMRTAVEGKVRYPDLAVTPAPVPNAVKTILDAVVLFEVLSDDTADTDLRDKKEEYARIPSIRRYVILEQARVSVRSLERVASEWREYQLPGGSLDLPEIGVSLPLAAIYRGLGL